MPEPFQNGAGESGSIQTGSLHTGSLQIGAAQTEPDPFAARQAVERLRSGVFDPLAVRTLTIGGPRLLRVGGLDTDPPSPPPHLCLRGAYGDGKSHSLQFLRDQALARGFAVSLVTLDPREVPFHHPRVVVRQLMRRLQLPGEERSLVRAWQAHAAEREPGTPPEALLPAQMPRLFRDVLSAFARSTRPLTPRQKRAKAHRRYRPRAFPIHLRRALAAEVVSLRSVRWALHYRQVPGARSGSLAWSGPEAALAMVRGMAELIASMGHAGWVVLFDEAESIAQLRAPSRRRAWQLLERWLEPASALLPVFAFTDDLLRAMEADGVTLPDVNMISLQGLDPADWEGVLPGLVALHGRAYGWVPEVAPLRRRLQAIAGQQTRLQLKALVHELDLQEQARNG